jgi:hypothetical protein
MFDFLKRALGPAGDFHTKFRAAYNALATEEINAGKPSSEPERLLRKVFRACLDGTLDVCHSVFLGGRGLAPVLPEAVLTSVAPELAYRFYVSLATALVRFSNVGQQQMGDALVAALTLSTRPDVHSDIERVSAALRSDDPTSCEQGSRRIAATFFPALESDRTFRAHLATSAKALRDRSDQIFHRGW